MVVSWYLLSPYLIILTGGGGGGGGVFQELKTTLSHEESVKWKIMTSVKAWLIEYVELHKVLIINQPGIWKLHSSYMALMVFMIELISSLEQVNQ